MQVTHPFEIDVISVKESTYQEYQHGGGHKERPSYEIFGTISTKSYHAYFPSPHAVHPAEEINHQWYFDAIMAEHSEIGRYFVRIGIMSSSPEFLLNILALHLKQLNLTGTCDTLLEVGNKENI